MKLSQFRFPTINKVTFAQLQLALGISRENVFPEVEPTYAGMLDGGGFYIDLDDKYGMYLIFTPEYIRITDIHTSIKQAIIKFDGTSSYVLDYGRQGDMYLVGDITVSQENVEVIICPPGLSASEDIEDIYELDFYFKRGVNRQLQDSPAPILVVDKSKIGKKEIAKLYCSTQELLDFAWVEQEYRHVILQEVLPILEQWNRMFRKKYGSASVDETGPFHRSDEEV